MSARGNEAVGVVHANLYGPFDDDGNLILADARALAEIAALAPPPARFTDIDFVDDAHAIATRGFLRFDAARSRWIGVVQAHAWLR